MNSDAEPTARHLEDHNEPGDHSADRAEANADPVSPTPARSSRWTWFFVLLFVVALVATRPIWGGFVDRYWLDADLIHNSDRVYTLQNQVGAAIDNLSDRVAKRDQQLDALLQHYEVIRSQLGLFSERLVDLEQQAGQSGDFVLASQFQQFEADHQMLVQELDILKTRFAELNDTLHLLGQKPDNLDANDRGDGAANDALPAGHLARLYHRIGLIEQDLRDFEQDYRSDSAMIQQQDSGRRGQGEQNAIRSSFDHGGGGNALHDLLVVQVMLEYNLARGRSFASLVPLLDQLAMGDPRLKPLARDLAMVEDGVVSSRKLHARLVSLAPKIRAGRSRLDDGVEDEQWFDAIIRRVQDMVSVERLEVPAHRQIALFGMIEDTRQLPPEELTRLADMLEPYAMIEGVAAWIDDARAHGKALFILYQISDLLIESVQARAQQFDRAGQ
ncbi:MAG: hypothetical protein AAF418_03700 [Pseudomonadota bacterium]